jgi:hypothetical protein
LTVLQIKAGEADDSASIDRVGHEEEDLLRAASANHEGADNSVGRQEGEGWMCECKHENPPLFLSCGLCDRIKNSEDISVIDLMGPDEDDSEIREATPAGHATNMPDGEDSGIEEATPAGHATIMDRTRDYLGPRYYDALLEAHRNGAAAGGAIHTPAGHATNRSEYALPEYDGGDEDYASGSVQQTHARKPKKFGMDIIVQSECTICQKCIGDERCKTFATCGHTFHKNRINEWIEQRLLKKKEPNCPNCRRVFEENEDFFDENAN